MRVLVACEFSGIVRNAFAALGHDAVSCDLLPSETRGKHYRGDVFDIINKKWDLIIAFPPCTYLSNSGVRWLWNKDGTKNPERWKQMETGAQFFRALLESDCRRIAVENPIQHKHAKAIIRANYSQIIQPWHFGHGETKATCLWLKGLPPLMSTNPVQGREQRIWKLPPSADRWKLRSRTFPGIAKAMATQWSV